MSFDGNRNMSGLQAQYIGEIRDMYLGGGSPARREDTLPATEPKTTPMIPHCHDYKFIPRDGICMQIKEKCAIPGARIGLYGLAGTGKTELAHAYALGELHQPTYRHLFRVDARSKKNFQADFVRIASRLKLECDLSDVEKTMISVKRWLERDEDPWFLLVDGADDPQEIGPMFDFLPQHTRGCIIFTSRYPDLAALMAGGVQYTLSVEPMSASESEQLLRNRCANDSDFQRVKTSLMPIHRDPRPMNPLEIVQIALYQKEGANSGDFTWEIPCTHLIPKDRDTRLAIQDAHRRKVVKILGRHCYDSFRSLRSPILEAIQESLDVLDRSRRRNEELEVLTAITYSHRPPAGYVLVATSSLQKHHGLPTNGKRYMEMIHFLEECGYVKREGDLLYMSSLVRTAVKERMLRDRWFPGAWKYEEDFKDKSFGIAAMFERFLR